MLHRLSQEDINTITAPFYGFTTADSGTSATLHPTEQSAAPTWYNLPAGYTPKLSTNIRSSPYRLNALRDILNNVDFTALSSSAESFTGEHWAYLRAAHTGLRRLGYTTVHHQLHDCVHNMYLSPTGVFHRASGFRTVPPEQNIPLRYMLAWQVSHLSGVVELVKQELQSKTTKIDIGCIVLHCLCFTGPYRSDWQSCPIVEVYADGDLAYSKALRTLQDLRHLSLLPAQVILGRARYTGTYQGLIAEMRRIALNPSPYNSNFNSFTQKYWRSLDTVLAAFLISHTPHLEHLCRLQRLSCQQNAQVSRPHNRFASLKSSNTDFDNVPVAKKDPGYFLFPAKHAVPGKLPPYLTGIVLNRFSKAIIPAFCVLDFCNIPYLLVPSTRKAFKGLMKLYDVPDRDLLAAEDLTTQAMLHPWNDDFPFAASEQEGLRYAGLMDIRHFTEQTEHDVFAEFITSTEEDKTQKSEDTLFHAIYIDSITTRFIHNFIIMEKGDNNVRSVGNTN